MRNSGCTYRQIGDELGVTTERARQIVLKAALGFDEWIKLSPEDYVLAKRYAWRIARRLSPVQRGLFTRLIQQRGVLTPNDLVHTQRGTRGVLQRRIVELAREAQKKVSEARMRPPEIFPPGSGCGRFVP